MHGGAVAQGVLYELPLRYKTAHHQRARRIAVEASRVADGMSGPHGRQHHGGRRQVAAEPWRGLTVVTNGSNIVSELRSGRT
jgi:hypothetical protein